MRWLLNVSAEKRKSSTGSGGRCGGAGARGLPRGGGGGAGHGGAPAGGRGGGRGPRGLPPGAGGGRAGAPAGAALSTRMGGPGPLVSPPVVRRIFTADG